LREEDQEELGGDERSPYLSAEGHRSLMPQVEHEGLIAKQTCCPNPTNNPLTSDLARCGDKPTKKHAKRSEAGQRAMLERDGSEHSQLSRSHVRRIVTEEDNLAQLSRVEGGIYGSALKLEKATQHLRPTKATA